MRRVEVTVPEDKSGQVAELAFACGIAEVSIVPKEIHKPGQAPATKHVIDMNVSTPSAKHFVGALSRAAFFSREDYHISIREPRANLTSESRFEATRPVPAPIIDIDQELWQFSHVTSSFMLRAFIASLLLAYGMIEVNWLFMAAGLIFLPFMPLVLAVSYGVLTGEKRLVMQAALAFFVATLLIIGASALVALAAEPPMLFDKFPPMIAGAVFSVATGIAAALSTADDAGHRQLVGLAAASQVALLPAWLGISLVFGFAEPVTEKLTVFGVNVLALIAGALIVYAWISARSDGPTRGSRARPPKSASLEAAEER